MEPDGPQRLSDLSTSWSLLRVVKQGSTLSSEGARNAMVLRYADPICRYVEAMVGKSEDSQELSQEFIVRMLRGDFCGASQDRGRFRDFLKTALRNMVINHWRRNRRRNLSPLNESHLGETALDKTWTTEWRDCVLAQTWEALRTFEQRRSDCLYYTLLQLRADHVGAATETLVGLLEQTANRRIRPDNLRQLLRRARVKFAQLLLEEVARDCANPTPALVADELRTLGLYKYVEDLLPDDWHHSGQLK